MSFVVEAPVTAGRQGRVDRPVEAGAFPARRCPPAWPGTTRPEDEAKEVLLRLPVLGAGSSERRCTGARMLLGWLTGQPGRTWQERWQASGADEAGRRWRDVPSGWLAARGHGPWRRQCLIEAVPAAIGADLLRPSLSWLVDGGGAHGGLLVRYQVAVRDPDGFARLDRLCREEGSISVPLTSQTAYRCALILAAKGGTIAELTVGDALELFAAEDRYRANAGVGRAGFFGIMHALGVFNDDEAAVIRRRRTAGQRSPEELIDRYGIACRPVRDLLVEYLRERQPALDYTSLEALAYYLGKRFWSDIEAHHPGIADLRLPREVADGWKQRLRTITTTITDAGGTRTQATAARVNYPECLTPVRAFYLDLAHWAVEDPARWGPWVAPCPVGEEEIDRRKDKLHRKSRIDARTRERLPALPALARSVAEHRKEATAFLQITRAARPGQIVTLGQTTATRIASARGTPDTVWVHDPVTGRRRNLSHEEDHAFWSWAIVEVLRATGVRVEESLEINHHSLVQYRLPTTGEIVPLLQILPSKTDAERLLVVSPDLAEVLSAIISRVRRRSGALPLVAAYDGGERTWSPPAPLLFQRRIGTEDRAITPGTVRSCSPTR
ncbi:site-specific integrase [Georgenia yuyongxinii]